MKSKPLFFSLTGFFFYVLLAGLACDKKVTSIAQDSHFNIQPSIQPSRTSGSLGTSNLITMFMGGDVMVGRGIDQV